MARLRSKTFFGKVKRLFLRCLDYGKSYFLYSGYSSYVSIDGGEPARVGRLRFCADPFLFNWGGHNWLFYESVDKAGKGYIGCYKEENGNWVQQGKVLEEDWHLSYPQVFTDDDKVYMIPESNEKHAVCLYEAVDFPRKWCLVKELIRGEFADSTLVKYRGWYYLACYKVPPRPIAELWCSDTLLGEWARHPMYMNINQSRRLKRCGGCFISEKNGLYRVAQDGNGMYGKRVFKVKVVTLSPTEYREGAAVEIACYKEAPKGFKHTYNQMFVGLHKYCVVDVHSFRLEYPHVIFCKILSVLIHKTVERLGHGQCH